jgi:enoyl-CoA hydratase
MDFKTLRYEREADGIALVSLNRPDKLNALSSSMLDELDACFSDIASASDVRGVVLTGAGTKSFAAGADIGRFPDLNAPRGYRFALRGQAVFNRIEQLSKPVIAAVNGFALGGGCELALACHLRIASERAVFGQPEVNLGILPGYGGSQRLPRLVGRGIATELILTGERIPAQRAYEIGLVNRVVPPDQLLDQTRELLRTILSKAPTAVAYALEALRASDLPLQDGLRYEAALFGQACATEDFKEGVAAFLERRDPVFRGK